MAGLIKPILQKFQSVYVSNLNSEVDLLDSTIPDIDTDFISIYQFVQMPEDAPLVEIFPFGDSQVDSEQMNVNALVTWLVANRVTVVGDTESEAGDILDVYLTAMTKAIIKNDATWGLDGQADIIRLVNINFPAEGSIEGTIIKEGALLWEVEVEYDFSS